MELDVNKVEEKDVKTAFDNKLVIDKYTFRLKKLKGHALFSLVNSFRKVAIKNNDNDDDESYSLMLDSIDDNYDIAMNSLEWSMNGVDFSPLYINGVCQVDFVETDVVSMYKLLSFVFESVMVFMSISQRL